MRISGIPYVQGRNAYSDPDGTKYGIAIHNTSNTATAAAEASYATRRTDGVSSHLYVDRTAVIQSIDTRDKAGHAGSSEGNNHAVAVEITGTNDKSRQWWVDNVDWPLLGASLAQVCRAYGTAVRRASVSEMQSNPRVRAFYSHNDMRLAWGGTTHDDPGPNFPWDVLFHAVNQALSGGTTVPEQPEEIMGQQMLVRFSDATDPTQVWLVDGIHRRPVAAADLPGVGNSQTHQDGFLGNLGNNGQVFVSSGNPDVWGVDVRSSVKVDAGELANALLADPAFASTLASAAFQGAQEAETK